jgi:predicted amidophosphoribosyltransferase
MFDFEDFLWEPQHIHDYHPHKIHGERNPRFDAVSGQLLDLKNKAHPNYTAAVTRFSSDVRSFLAQRLDGAGPFVCLVVPSSTAGRHSDGLCAILERVAKQDNRLKLQATCLRRHTTIPKLSRGGAREVEVHLNSIDIPLPALVSGKAVLLLDDISTSGNSMVACRQLLLQAGATTVMALAIGKTTHG